MYEEKKKINFDDLISNLSDKNFKILEEADLSSYSKEDLNKLKEILKKELKEEITSELKLEIKEEIALLVKKNQSVLKEKTNTEIKPVIKEVKEVKKKEEKEKEALGSGYVRSASSHHSDINFAPGIIMIVIGAMLFLLPQLLEVVQSSVVPVNSSGSELSEITASISGNLHQMLSAMSYLLGVGFSMKGILQLKMAAQ